VNCWMGISGIMSPTPNAAPGSSEFSGTLVLSTLNSNEGEAESDPLTSTQFPLWPIVTFVIETFSLLVAAFTALFAEGFLRPIRKVLDHLFRGSFRAVFAVGGRVRFHISPLR
jgi:hypothetical protein